MIRRIAAFALLLLPVVALPAQRAAPVRRALLPLDRGWEYRWGDSPLDAAGVPLWVREEPAAEAWQPIDFPSNPPGREGRTNVWYRLRLPAGPAGDAPLRDPRLFIYSIDLNAEFYLDGRPLYAFGSLDVQGRGRFAGWPWHLIPLPEDYAGKWLHVRVFSDYLDIGLWGDLLLGSGVDQVLRLFRRDGVRLLVAVLSFVIFSIFLVLHFLRGRQRSFLYLSLITLALVVRVLAETHLKQLVLYAPLLFEYIKAGSYFVLPVFVTLFLQDVLGERYRLVTRLTWGGILALFAGSVLTSLSGLARICDIYVFLDVLSVFTMVFLGILIVIAALRGNAEARLMCVNFLVFALLGLYSILVSRGLFPWTDEINYLLLFQFSVGLAALLFRRMSGFHRQLEHTGRALQERSEELRVLNQALEQKVAERTEQLEQANRKLREEKITLQITSITDGLTGVYNRTYTLDRFEKELGEARRYRKQLSAIMFDLDHFKRVNDFFGHQVGDAVLQRIAGVFRDTLRESDLVGRYGGEEFVLVLPETDCAEAAQVAERIRREVEGMDWSERGLKVTISGGVAEWGGDTADELLRRVDFLMYRAKEMGRNRVVSEPELHRAAEGA